MSVAIIAAILGVATSMFAASTGLLGIRLRAEAERRQRLEQQVYESKRTAYAAFNEIISGVLAPEHLQGSLDSDKAASQFLELRKDIWTYGSPEVIQTYSDFQHYYFGESPGAGGLVLMARLILAMRGDMGLSNDHITELHILRMFLTDAEEKYDEAVAQARDFISELETASHESV